MVNEKYCRHCDHMIFCHMYQSVIKLAGVLNANINIDIAGKLPVESMIDNMAHDCKQFEQIKD